MRVKKLPRCRHFGPQDGACSRLGNEQALPIRAAERNVRRVDAFSGGDAEQRLGDVRQAPDGSEARMADDEAAFLIHREPIRSAQTSMQLGEDPELGDTTTGLQRDPPHLLRPSRCDEQVRHPPHR
jgi:hypothetical protein